MPQMMPLNWLILMLFFIILFIIMLSLFHFIKMFNLIDKPNYLKKSLSHKQTNWLW